MTKTQLDIELKTTSDYFTLEGKSNYALIIWHKYCSEPIKLSLDRTELEDLSRNINSHLTKLVAFDAIKK